MATGRRMQPSCIKDFDRTAIDAEADAGPRVLDEAQLERVGRAKQIWDEGIDPRRTIAEVYLRQHRKLELPDHIAGNVLRFHPRCPWRNESTGKTEYVTALIAAFRSIDDDTITGIHRIRINADGSKYGRKMLGIIERAAVKLDPVGHNLHIGEGVESCLAGRQLGFSPAWALGSVGAISFFPVLDNVQCLLIYAEAGDASAQAITICGKRWRRAGRRVRIVKPLNGAADLNDVLMQRTAL